jgi:hypothetical protein
VTATVAPGVKTPWCTRNEGDPVNGVPSTL